MAIFSRPSREPTNVNPRCLLLLVILGSYTPSGYVLPAIGGRRSATPSWSRTPLPA